MQRKIFAGLVFCAMSVYAAEPEADPEELDDERFFESAYVSCLTRYEGSKLTRQEADCVCSKLAVYALTWRKHHASGEALPPAPQKIFNRCFNP